MHLFTVIQLVCLGFLLGIKFTPAAIGFPFFLAMLIPLRLLGLPKIFTDAEINAVSYPESRVILFCVLSERCGFQEFPLTAEGPRNAGQ